MRTTTKPTTTSPNAPRPLRVRTNVRAGGSAQLITQSQTGGIIRLH